MLRKLGFVKIIVAVMVLALSAVSQAARLTDELIDQYINSVGAMEVLDVENYIDVDNVAEAQAFSLVRIVEVAPVDSRYEAAEKIVKDAGFKDLLSWAEIGDRINAAFIALSIQNDSVNMYDEMTKMEMVISQLNLPPEEEKMMMERIQATRNMMDEINEKASDSDKRVVQNNMDKLRNAATED